MWGWGWSEIRGLRLRGTGTVAAVVPGQALRVTGNALLTPPLEKLLPGT